MRGFTLVELSIVLVILGLLVGGILTGQNLIRAAEIRSVTVELQTYSVAVQTFVDQYGALPGDMDDATDYWGELNSTPATCRTTVATGVATCNGDGNGRLDASPASHESFRFWQHLANAGLIEGSYSGVTDGTTNFSASPANGPASKASDSIWYTATDIIGFSGHGYWFDGALQNYMVVARYNPNSTPANGFTPEEVWNLDVKMDDGVSGTGKLIVMNWNACSEAVNSADVTAAYALSSSVDTCGPAFKKVF